MTYMEHLMLFIIILAVYFHLLHFLQVNPKQQVYELDFISKSNLHQMCDAKLPIVINFLQSSSPPPPFSLDEVCTKIAPRTECKLRYCGFPTEFSTLPLQTIYQLCQTDNSAKYYCEWNNELCSESVIGPFYRQFETQNVRPQWWVHAKHDLIFGSKSATTPWRYFCDYSNYFLLVLGGRLKVRLCHWKHTPKFASAVTLDYSIFEFRTDNTTTDQQQDDVDLQDGQCLFLPSYWWHQLEFVDDTTFVCVFAYQSALSIIGTLPQYAAYYFHSKTTPSLNVDQ